MKLSREALVRDLTARLSGKRMRHTLGVEETAVRLAPRLGVDVASASVAALLHDCAKELSEAQMMEYADLAGADPEERANEVLLHAPVGAYLAQARYGVEDAGILRAIRMHTTGSERLEPLCVVISLSDMIEPTRGYPEVEAPRALARTDIMGAYLLTMKRRMVYLFDRDLPVHPRSLAVYNALVHGPEMKEGNGALYEGSN